MVYGSAYAERGAVTAGRISARVKPGGDRLLIERSSGAASGGGGRGGVRRWGTVHAGCALYGDLNIPIWMKREILIFPREERRLKSPVVVVAAAAVFYCIALLYCSSDARWTGSTGWPLCCPPERSSAKKGVTITCQRPVRTPS